MRNATTFRQTLSLMQALMALSLFVCYGCEDPTGSSIATPRPRKDPTVSRDGKTPPKGKQQCLALVGGEASQDEPQTALLIGNLRENNYKICSGTWVSDTTMITASHCLEDTETGGMSYVPGAGEIVAASDVEILLKSAIKPVKVIIGAPEFTIDRFDQVAYAEGMHRDLAVLVFPPKTAPAYVPVLEQKLKSEDEVTLVGYGAINVPGAGSARLANEIDIRRRRGTNALIAEPKLVDPGFYQLQEYLKFNLYNIAGSAVSDGQTDTSAALVGEGDAGGPLLVGSALSGVAVGGGIIPFGMRRFLKGATGISHFAPLQSSFATSFLKQAEESGAKITRVQDPKDAKIMTPQDSVEPKAPSEPLDDVVQEPTQKLESADNDGSDDESDWCDRD